MCGICGKIAQGLSEEDLAHQIHGMMTRIAHRGPDDQGQVVLEASDALIGLGHHRLTILDLSSAGRQPMADENRQAWIVYNGEVYNFREIRKELEAIGHRFRSSTDTEVVLRAYLAWGTECLSRLEGMFAFAIWDDANRRLVLARDRAGIKPLHYGLTPAGIVFGSEIKSLLALPEFGNPEVDPGRIDEFLTLGYISAPRTAFRGIQKLLPGHYAIWEDGKFRVLPYRARKTMAPVSRTDWKEAFLEVFERAVKRQMVSDVPVGAFLSGGIDSSLVVQMMSRATPEPVKTFAIGFGKGTRSETIYAEEVGKHFSTDHASTEVSHDALDLMPALVEQLDEPFADSSIIPMYLISRETRKSVKVALSGDGGDELFAGYTNYVGERILRWMRMLPSPLLSAIEAGAGRGAGLSAFFRRLENVLSSRDQPLHRRYVQKSALSGTHKRMGLYTDSFRSDALGDSWVDEIEGLLAGYDQADAIDRVGALDFGYYLPNDVLTKVDRMSMLCSLEVRVPFLDEEVVDFAAQVPSALKLRGLTTKYLLRLALSDELPERITRRPKQGFEIPVDTWFSGRFCEFAAEILLDDQARGRTYFESQAVESILADHRSGRVNRSRLIFALICLELWFRHVVEGKAG